MHITLRPANTDDTVLISEMARRIWHVHYTPIIGDAQVEYMLNLLYSSDALRAQMQEGQQYWLPESDGIVMGYLSIANTAPGKYFLHKFYMDNEKRGLGFGKVILERLMAQYPDMQELRLNVNRQNYKSINFYFRVGFTIDFCLDNPIGNGYEMNDFQMVLKLG